MIKYAFEKIKIYAIEARNEIGQKEKIAPLYELGFEQGNDCLILLKK